MRKELFESISEILGDSEIELKASKGGHHYRVTPYSFETNIIYKLVANPFIDMGQGLLECVKDVYKILNPEQMDEIIVETPSRKLTKVSKIGA